MNKSVLVLEGGGMRGLYGAGVLDVFAKNNLIFSDIVGVSMGACNGANYLSNQSERNYRIPYTFINDQRYLSYKRWIKGGELFDMDFVFETISNKLDQYDYETFAKNDSRLHIVTTECVSGNSIYFSKFNSGEEFGKLLRASSSLPFAAKMVKYKDKMLLDGGISDPIPLYYAKTLSAKKIVLILTQPKEYKKSPFKLGFLLNLFYPKFKGLREAITIRHKKYNDSMDEVNTLEDKGEIFVIRPKYTLSASRIERNKTKLKDTYEQGITDAVNCYEELKRFLSKR
ncbi:MAG: patatin family protein [Campylobacteraceae bacterium]|nr:patatin family protein [Campylobacteraceae bacterium]